MTEEEYIAKRLDEQIEWYDKKSKWNQKWYKRLKTAEFVLAASVPVLVAFVTYHWFIKVAIATAGSAVAVISAVHGLYNFHENWIEYRSVCEALKREKHLYLTRSGIYTETENPFSLLVDRVESIMARENIAWAQVHRQKVSVPQRAVLDRSSSTGS
ncbi:MAG: DUF4231 domain-containing protein [Thermoanaerobacteraceae bacterium]|nr:DUF4231 domain-containing protein [Thermoanaerobacteraceae bacterium]